ncbi:ABC transporter ATP-binding protein [Bradyrhizobium canariense]|uniref:ABC transporter ATP-binding protein n=1 Tax=Bradyrhizobium canariense TaxID=255045 RepID=UPI001FCCCD11|nr:ABC transporter ATP-binding protein [Bradyrhizobium canariense]
MIPLLELKDVSRRFGGVAALSDVSFSVPAGAVIGLIGPNGSGKTTLMNVISGVDAPTKGAVLLDGLPIQGVPANTLARRGVSRTFQHIRLIPELTAGQNVTLALHAPSAGPFDILLRLPRLRRIELDRHARAVELLRKVGIGQHASTLAGDLSYGDRRRVEIARALASEPRLLLLDEPAAGMTHGERTSLRDLIAGLPALGVTVLLVEHDMDLMMSVCDEIHVLNQGSSIASGKPEEVRANPRVIEAYLGAEDA